MSKIVIIKTSPHRNGNSDILADYFKKGAEESGNSVEEIRLADYKINYCMGCYGTSSSKACTNTGTCWQNDDMQKLIPVIQNADVLVFATPVYFYSLSGQMKVFLDRTVPLYGGQYKFSDIYLLATSESGSKSAMNATVESLKGWIGCFGGTRLKGVAYGVGVLQPGAVKNRENELQEAYNMGKSIK